MTLEALEEVRDKLPGGKDAWQIHTWKNSARWLNDLYHEFSPLALSVRSTRKGREYKFYCKISHAQECDKRIAECLQRCLAVNKPSPTLELAWQTMRKSLLAMSAMSMSFVAHSRGDSWGHKSKGSTSPQGHKENKEK